MSEAAESLRLMMALMDRAMTAYHQGAEQSEGEGLRHAGALVTFDGLAKNGGLVGGAIENCFHTQDDLLVSDAQVAFRWFGLDEVASLIELADREYRRCRPTGTEELSDEDAALWAALDKRYFEIADDDVIEGTLGRLAEFEQLDEG